MEHLTPLELKPFLQQNPDAVVIDVRESWEHDLVRLPGARLLPLKTLPAKASEVLPDRAQAVVLHCHHGMRSMRACEFLESQGYTRLYNLTGGIAQYAAEVDPSLPQY